MRWHGYSLVEMIITMGVIGILASAAFPLFSDSVDSAKVALADKDISTITKAIITFNDQTHSYPGMIGSYDILQGSGDAVSYPGDGGSTVWGIASADVAALSDVLINNTHGYALYDSDIEVGWQGPYLEESPTDPWANKYLIRVKGFQDDTAVWVISAGADESLETSSTADSLNGDDIGKRIQ